MIKTKMFYSHLVDLSDLVVKLECLKLDEQEREEIVDLIEDILHHRILDSLLDVIPPEHHEGFLERMIEDPTDPQLIAHLKEISTYDPEIKIMTVTEIVKQEIVLDIYLSKPSKKKRY